LMMAARLPMTVQSGEWAQWGRSGTVGPDRAIRVESGSVAGRPSYQSGGAAGLDERGRPTRRGDSPDGDSAGPDRIAQSGLASHLGLDHGPPNAPAAVPAGPAERLLNDSMPRHDSFVGRALHLLSLAPACC
jgi:hypothetical protein